MRRQGRRWKASTREGNRHLIDRYLIPFFGAMPVSKIGRADVRRWFDSIDPLDRAAFARQPSIGLEIPSCFLGDLITTQAKSNLSSRSGIGGVLSATWTSLGIMSGRSKRRLNRYSNSDK